MKACLRLGFIMIVASTIIMSCESSSQTRSVGEKVFRAKCTRCHGLDGKKGKKGAKDLNLSTKSLEYRINQIKKGKDKMPSFSTRLNDEQIEAVARYTMERFPQQQEGTQEQ